MQLLSPPAANELTGGYLYNRNVAQRVAGLEYYRVAPENLVRQLKSGADGYVLDSLYLAWLIRDRQVLNAADAPVVLLCHGLPRLNPHQAPSHAAKLAGQEAALLRLMAGAIVPSAFMAARLLSLGMTSARVVVCRPGIDDDLLADRPLPAVPQRPWNVLTVASWSRGKGHSFLLEALAAVRPLPWHWTCVGDPGPDRAGHTTALRRISQLGLEHRITIRPAVSGGDLVRHYREADLFALATEFESYGMALAEAVAAGVPVISNQVGAVEEVVKHGVDGVLCNPGDRAGWHAALSWLLGERAPVEVLRPRPAEARLRFSTWREVADRFDAAVTGLTTRGPGG